MLMVSLVDIGIRCIAFEQKYLFPLVEQIVNQSESQLALTDTAFASSNVKNGHVHVTTPRLKHQE